MPESPLLLDSITDADASAKGRICVSGSHGGLYAAAVASRAGLRAVVLNDAGRGFHDAGIAGVRALAALGMAACAVDCMTAEIGSATDMLNNGVISYVNSVASTLGVAPGDPLARALEKLQAAPEPSGMMDPVPEARWEEEIVPGHPPLLCVDSASLIKPTDAGRIIVTGSHGGLIGGDPRRACKAKARFVTFSDAGRGRNDIGLSRLPALADQGVAAATLDANSCAIGSAQSALSSGVISHANGPASGFGIEPGTPLRQALEKLVRMN